MRYVLLSIGDGYSIWDSTTKFKTWTQPSLNGCFLYAFINNNYLDVPFALSEILTDYRAIVIGEGNSESEFKQKYPEEFI